MRLLFQPYMKRGYVEKRDKEGVQRKYQVFTLKNDAVSGKTETENTGAEKSKLFPTDLGLVVTDFLKQHFDDIMDYSSPPELKKSLMKWHREKCVEQND